MPRAKRSLNGSKEADFAAVRNILIPYRRVSTREQADKGAGLAAQKTRIAAALTLREQTALSWDYVDKGKSGKNMNREQLKAAIADIRAGKAGGLIVSKLDRLSRDLMDFATLMVTADKENWNIVLLDVSLDLSTPLGKAMAGMMAIFAQFERDMISQRTRDGLAEKRAEGVRLGRRRTIDDDLLHAIVGMYHSANNYSDVARQLNDVEVPTLHNGKMWYASTVKSIVDSQDGRALVEQLEETFAA